MPPIHANEVYGTIARNASASAEGFGKKNSERFVRHLSGAIANSRCRPLAFAWPLIRTL